jgi:hypothetical protein
MACSSLTEDQFRPVNCRNRTGGIKAAAQKI